MKPLIPILVVATTSLAVASVQLHQQASAQRERADTEMALRQKQEARVAQLERAQARLERELQVARAVPAIASPPAVAEGARTAQRNAVRAAPGGAFAAIERADGRPPPVFTLRGAPNMRDSPAARNFMRSRMKVSMRKTYEDLDESLGIPQEKANELIDLLADQQTRMLNRPPVNDPQAMQQHMREAQQKNNAEIATLIGQDKLDEWADYQKSLPYRAQLSQVREQLDSAGVPMTETQRTEMLAAITEETHRSPRPAYNPGVPQEEYIAQVNEWQTRFDESLLDRARQVLTAEQFKSYKEYQDYQTEMRNSFSTRLGGRYATMGVMAPGTGPVVIQSENMAVLAPAVPAQPERK